MSAKADKSLTRMLIALILAVVILAGSVITAVAMIKQDEINNADENNTNADGMIDLIDRKSTRLNCSHRSLSRMPSSA